MKVSNISFFSSLKDIEDYQIYNLSKYLQDYPNKIKIVKLTKNKITDDGAHNLFKALAYNENVHTINLTSNQCTEKVFDYIIELVKTNKVLKNISLF